MTIFVLYIYVWFGHLRHSKICERHSVTTVDIFQTYVTSDYILNFLASFIISYIMANVDMSYILF